MCKRRRSGDERSHRFICQLPESRRGGGMGRAKCHRILGLPAETNWRMVEREQEIENVGNYISATGTRLSFSWSSEVQ